MRFAIESFSNYYPKNGMRKPKDWWQKYRVPMHEMPIILCLTLIAAIGNGTMRVRVRPRVQWA